MQLVAYEREIFHNPPMHSFTEDKSNLTDPYLTKT